MLETTYVYRKADDSAYLTVRFLFEDIDRKGQPAAYDFSRQHVLLFFSPDVEAYLHAALSSNYYLHCLLEPVTN